MAFDPDAYLGTKPAEPSAQFDPDAYLAGTSGGRVDAKSGTWVPNKKARAVFTDIPDHEFEAADLWNIREDKKPKKAAAFIGGALDTATFGAGDEIGAALQSLVSDKPYTELRGENRAAMADAERWDPKLNAYGKAAGMVASAPLLGPAKGKALLSLANTGRAATYGAGQALGDSEAELVRSKRAAGNDSLSRRIGGFASGDDPEFAKAAWDATKGAAAGVAVNTALGAIGKTVAAGKKYVEGLPEKVAGRADAKLTDDLTLGAPASMRDNLFGDLGQDKKDVLSIVRSNPEIVKALEAGDRPRAALLIREAQKWRDAFEAAGISALDSTKGPVEANPLVAALEAHRARLAANPSTETQAIAKKAQTLIDSINARYVPEQPKTPEGGALLKALVGNAEKYDIDRAAHSAEDFMDAVERFGLAKTANDPAKRLASIEKSIAQLSKYNDDIYTKAAKKKPIYVANFTGALRDHADAMRLEYGSGSLPDSVEGFAAEIARTAAARQETTIDPRKLREIITNQQDKAFSGKFTNPTDAKEAWQEVTRAMRAHLESHVEKNAGKAALEELKMNNRDISILIPFKTSAAEEVAASKLLPPVKPDTRTGKLSIGEAKALADATEDPDMQRALTGALYQQIGPESSKALASGDRSKQLLDRLNATLTHKGNREQSPATTLRHHAKSIANQLGVSETSLGVAAIASGHLREGVAVVATSLARKYGIPMIEKAENALSAMVMAQRAGAQQSHLLTIGKLAGLPVGLAADLADVVLPRAAASFMVKKDKR